MRKILLFIILLLPIQLGAQEVLNTGLVKGLWFSDNQIFAEQKTILNAIFYNNSDYDVSGTVVFYDNDDDFYEEKVIINKNTLEHIKAPYQATVGEHAFEAQITLVRKMEDGEETEEVKAKNNIVLGSETLEIDLDTDGDKIGNQQDPDDDNDGYSDEEEIVAGSDPLKKISTPKNAESIETIEQVLEEVHTASDNIFARANAVRQKTVVLIEKQMAKLNEAVVVGGEEEDEREKISGGFIKKDPDSPKDTEDETKDWKLTLLKILHIIFDSVILSLVFLIMIVWILFKLISRLIFR